MTGKPHSLLQRVLGLLAGQAPAGHGTAPDALELAVAALLVEAARMNDTFDEAERTTIARLLRERFDLQPAETERLLTEAEAAAQESSQLFGFTSVIVKRLEAEERIRIIEMLWEVAYADGTLDPHEDMLLRRIAGLIHVPDQARGAARKRVLTRLGLAT